MKSLLIVYVLMLALGCRSIVDISPAPEFGASISWQGDAYAREQFLEVWCLRDADFDTISLERDIEGWVRYQRHLQAGLNNETQSRTIRHWAGVRESGVHRALALLEALPKDQADRLADEVSAVLLQPVDGSRALADQAQTLMKLVDAHYDRFEVRRRMPVVRKLTALERSYFEALGAVRSSVVDEDPVGRITLTGSASEQFLQILDFHDQYDLSLRGLVAQADTIDHFLVAHEETLIPKMFSPPAAPADYDEEWVEAFDDAMDNISTLIVRLSHIMQQSLIMDRNYFDFRRRAGGSLQPKGLYRKSFLAIHDALNAKPNSLEAAQTRIKQLEFALSEIEAYLDVIQRSVPDCGGCGGGHDHAPLELLHERCVLTTKALNRFVDDGLSHRDDIHGACAALIERCTAAWLSHSAY